MVLVSVVRRSRAPAPDGDDDRLAMPDRPQAVAGPGRRVERRARPTIQALDRPRLRPPEPAVDLLEDGLIGHRVDIVFVGRPARPVARGRMNLDDEQPVGREVGRDNVVDLACYRGRSGIVAFACPRLQTVSPPEGPPLVAVRSSHGRQARARGGWRARVPPDRIRRPSPPAGRRPVSRPPSGPSRQCAGGWS
jgi:hypothetical protein